MKTYFKRPYDKPLANIFYSSLDTSNDFPPRANFRQRVVQPSTKEQQRLLSSSSSSRLQHVHSGKYGIRPIWPSDELFCEQWQHGRKSRKYRSSSIASLSSKNDRHRCIRYKSDLQKKSILPLTPSLSYAYEEYGSLWMLASVSLLLLLLTYIFYRRRSTNQNESKFKEQRRRQSLEDALLKHESFEYHIPPIRSLPTITEETPTTLSPSSSYQKVTPLSSSTDTTFSQAVTDESSTCNSSSISLRQQKPVPNNINHTNNSVQITKEEQPAPSNRRLRSRFEPDSNRPSVEIPTTDNDFIPPVIVRKASIAHQNMIKDDFTSLEQVHNAVKEVGLVRSQLIFGIDYTISNLETGKNSFRGLSLHYIQDGSLNPYQSVITIIGRTLEKFDSDSLIPAFGFGDRATLDRKIFPLRMVLIAKVFLGVLEAYNEITPKVRMSGPTNFAPLIREAVRIVKKTEQYHILVIVADGQVTNERQTKDAIVEASNYPLSIVMVGVGDGPWDMMEEFDDSLPTRQFDNFQFVNYNSIVEASANTDSTFALHALMEIPSQYAAIKALGLLKND